MARLNWRIVEGNVSEAREQLDKIEGRIANGDRPSEGELQIMLEHAYHHLNVAWNARRAPIDKYRHMSDRDFNAWGKFPCDLEMMVVPVRDRRRRMPNKGFPADAKKRRG